MGDEPTVTISGADDATLARVAAILAEWGIAVHVTVDATARIVAGDVTIDVDRREVIGSDGTVVRPTTNQFEVLVLLAVNPGVVISRERILDAALGQPFIDPRTVDTYVMQLRRGIPGLVIETVRGAGYRILAPERSMR